MRKLVLRAGFLWWLAVAGVSHARETWQWVHEDPEVRIAVDLGSIKRDSQTATFRERHVPAEGTVDSASLRRIAEIQYRRRADCRLGRLAVLSKAIFSDRDALLGYEATRPEKSNWLVPQDKTEQALYEFVCGGKS